MQFQVPQFIETEDRILGQITMKQFIYMCGFGGAAALLFFVLTPIIWVIVATPLIAGGFAVAFVKVNGRPFVQIARAAFRYYWEPQTYVWQPEHPNLPKTNEAMGAAAEGGLSLEKIVAGIALKSALQQVQTGSGASPYLEAMKRSFTRGPERYEIVRRVTGLRQAAKRVDYR